MRAKKNPIGRKVDQGGQPCRVGKGLTIHLYSPALQSHLCESGKNAGVKGGSGAKPVATIIGTRNYVTCMRCNKLAEINVQEGRLPWDPP